MLELVKIFAKSHAALRAHLLGARSPHVIVPRSLGRKDYAHEAHTFGTTPRDGPFPEFLNFVPGADGEYGVFPFFVGHVE